MKHFFLQDHLFSVAKSVNARLDNVFFCAAGMSNEFETIINLMWLQLKEMSCDDDNLPMLMPEKNAALPCHTYTCKRNLSLKTQQRP